MWLQQKLTIVETASHSILCFIFGDSDENITWNVMDCMCKVQGASCLVSEKTKKRHQLSKRSKTFQKKKCGWRLFVLYWLSASASVPSLTSLSTSTLLNLNVTSTLSISRQKLEGRICYCRLGEMTDVVFAGVWCSEGCVGWRTRSTPAPPAPWPPPTPAGSWWGG